MFQPGSRTIREYQGKCIGWVEDPITAETVWDLLSNEKFKINDGQENSRYNGIYIQPEYVAEAKTILASQEELLGFFHFEGDAKNDGSKDAIPATREPLGVHFKRQSRKTFERDRERINAYINWSPTIFYYDGLVRLPQITEIWARSRRFKNREGRQVTGIDYLVKWHSDGPDLYNWLQDWDGSGELHLIKWNMPRPAELPRR